MRRHVIQLGMDPQAVLCGHFSSDSALHSMGPDFHAIEGNVPSGQGTYASTHYAESRAMCTPTAYRLLLYCATTGLRNFCNSWPSCMCTSATCGAVDSADRYPLPGCRWMWESLGSVPWPPSFSFHQTSSMPCRHAASDTHILCIVP